MDRLIDNKIDLTTIGNHKEAAKSPLQPLLNAVRLYGITNSLKIHSLVIFVVRRGAKRNIIFLIVSISLLGGLLGCSNNDDKSKMRSQSYSYNEAISRGDVVYLNKVYNFEKFEHFITNLKNKKADSIRITGYTDEGDPIFKDVNAPTACRGGGFLLRRSLPFRKKGLT